MTYPPGSPGYPPSQSAGSYGAPAAPSFKADDGESHLKQYLTIGVATLGVAAYLLSFAELFSISSDDLQTAVKLTGDLPLGIAAALLAALLAGVSLISKGKNLPGVTAAIAVLGALDVITFATNQPSSLQIAWSLWLILGIAVVQAALAATALLLDAGVITAPAPRPKYDPYGHYGQYGYYGQQQAPYQQSGYGTQYGGYPSGPTTGGFSAQPAPQQSSQHGSPTPPTGFPSFSPPPSSSSSGASGQGTSAEHGSSGQGQQSFGQGQQPQAPSGPSQP